MINYLKDIKKETLIGQLPDVINSNNESIRKEFNWIFDSSLNRLTKSVYAPAGSVKAHFGEFTNLACEYFTVKNVDSLKYSIQDSVESIINETLNVSSMQTVMAALTNIANSSFIDPSLYDISALCDISTLIVNHNVLNNRFKDADFIDDDQQDFCHDAAAIVYKKDGNNNYITVKQALDQVGTYDTSINELNEEIQKCNSSINSLTETVENCDASINSIKLVNQRQDTSISQLKTNVQTSNSSINTLFERTQVLNSSIIILNNQIQNLNSSINEINSNNLSRNINSLNVLKNKNNCVLEHIISNDDTEVDVKIKIDDLNHEYNLKFIVEPGVEYINLIISNKNGSEYWYNQLYSDNFKLYHNLDDGLIGLKFGEEEHTIVLQLDRTENPEIIDITINRYTEKNDEKTAVCMLIAKTLKLVK